MRGEEEEKTEKRKRKGKALKLATCFVIPSCTMH